MSRDLISIIIPAFNEEKYLPATLQAVARSAARLQSRSAIPVEVIVVDNANTDSTAQIAAAAGARVVRESLRNIARVRNTGAAAASGHIFVFLDADTLIPDELLPRIHAAMLDARCLGGAVGIDYRPQKFLVRAYLGFWRLVGKLARLAQGATQFCRPDAFQQLRGFDESMFMAEDADFFLRLKKLARRKRAHVTFIDDLRVVSSTRRFDRWPLWRTLIWTNPFFILPLRRMRAAWRGWYDAPVR